MYDSECPIEGTTGPPRDHTNRRTEGLRVFHLLETKSETTFVYQLSKTLHECGLRCCVEAGVVHVSRQKACFSTLRTFQNLRRFLRAQPRRPEPCANPLESSRILWKHLKHSRTFSKRLRARPKRLEPEASRGANLSKPP